MKRLIQISCLYPKYNNKPWYPLVAQCRIILCLICSFNLVKYSTPWHSSSYFKLLESLSGINSENDGMSEANYYETFVFVPFNISKIRPGAWRWWWIMSCNFQQEGRFLETISSKDIKSSLHFFSLVLTIIFIGFGVVDTKTSPKRKEKWTVRQSYMKLTQERKCKM